MTSRNVEKLTEALVGIYHNIGHDTPPGHCRWLAEQLALFSVLAVDSLTDEWAYDLLGDGYSDYVDARPEEQIKASQGEFLRAALRRLATGGPNG